jgi:hypothetical protein
MRFNAAVLTLGEQHNPMAFFGIVCAIGEL